MKIENFLVFENLLAEQFFKAHLCCLTMGQIKSFFLAIGWRYLHVHSQTFFKKIETTMR